MKNIEQFFQNYSRASLSGESSDIAAFYDKEFLIVSVDKTVAFKNDEAFIKWLDEVHEFNKEAGLQKMTVKHLEESQLGDSFLKVTVTWEATFSKNPNEPIPFDIHYIINVSKTSYKIVMYISEENQEELMREKQVL